MQIDLRIPTILSPNTKPSLPLLLAKTMNKLLLSLLQTPPLPSAPPLDIPISLASSPSRPNWLNAADNEWQLIAAALVGLQSVPGLIILYGSMVKKKWAVNSAFMALYAFAAVLLCWVLWAHRMSFGKPIDPLTSFPAAALTEGFLSVQSSAGMFANAAYTFFQFAFAAITVILLAGSLLGRMNFYAWMLFVPLWLTCSYTVGAYTIWGDGFLAKLALVDFAGGYVIHLSSGIAGFTAAYWVGPRITHDRQDFPPNNIIHMLGGAGFLWLGWSGFNGGAPCSANRISSLAILNTHLSTATSLFIWLSLDMIFYNKSSVIGAVQGVITGLVCITPAAGVVEPWAAMLMGASSGSIPWYTMMVLNKRLSFLQKVDDTLGVFHTHAVAGTLGGLLAGLLAHPRLLLMFYEANSENHHHPHHGGLAYSIAEHGHRGIILGLRQLGVQVLGAVFVAAWNIVITSIICLVIRRLMPLRMNNEDLKIGDDAVHGEEAYAIWGDGARNSSAFVRRGRTPKLPVFCSRFLYFGA